MRPNISILLISILLMVGCSESDDKNEEPELQTVSTDLNSDFIGFLWYENSDIVTIRDEGEYIVKSSNPEKVSVELINDKMLRLSTLSVGEAVISIIDKSNPAKKTSFKCYGYEFSGRWVQAQIEIHVVSSSKTVSSAIRQEVLKKANACTAFHFGNSDKLTVTNSDNTESVGTYEWVSPHNLVLILRYNNNEEYHIIDYPYPGHYPVEWEPMERFLIPPAEILLMKSYTSEYQAKYPNANVTEVTLFRYLESDTYKWWDKTKWWNNLSDCEKDKIYNPKANK